MYSNPIQSLTRDNHTQQGDCPCLYCLMFIFLSQKVLCEASFAVTENCETNEEIQQCWLRIYLIVWY